MSRRGANRGAGARMAVLGVALIGFFALMMWVAPGTASAGSCGNGNCNGSETCSSCAADCGACPAVCGDSSCDGGETCSSCTADCGVCPSVCGDGSCETDEDCATCATDCGVCAPDCGDGVCESSETCASCSADCGLCSICGNGICGPAESCDVCAEDCGACVCGDGTCQSTESCSTCAADCGTCSSCGDGTCDATESCASCSDDCGVCASCGDGVCGGTEDCGNCSADCGGCVTCGNGTCDVGESCTSCSSDCGACTTGNDIFSCPPVLPACTPDANDCCYRDFTAGAILIPMDRCHQSTEGSGVRGPPVVPNAFCSDSTGGADDGLFQAYGLSYRLMQQGIPVYWVINPTKDPAALTNDEKLSNQTYTDRDIDAWVVSGGASPPTMGDDLASCTGSCVPPVLHLDDDLDPIAGSYTKRQFPTRGGAFVIAPEDRARFQAFMTRTGEFAGFAGNDLYDFSMVELYEIQPGAEVQYLDYRGSSAPYDVFNGGNSAPVAVTLDYPTPRLAREAPAAVSSKWLAKAKLNDPADPTTCKLGTFDPPTAVYCDLKTSEMASGQLTAGNFDWAWLDLWNAPGNSCGSAEAKALIQELHTFMSAVPGVKDGNSVFLMGSPLDIAEVCEGMEPLGAVGGLDLSNQTPKEPLIVRYPANVFAQFGDMPMAFASGATGKWGYSSNGYQSLSSLVRLVSEDKIGGGSTACSLHKSTPDCDVYGSSGDMDDLATYARFKDDPANGIMFYMGGRNISQNGNSAHLRMVLNSFLALPAGLVRANPDSESITEVSRGNPIVASVDGVEAQYQGTLSIIQPPRVVRTYKGAANDATFRFPHFTGHMRAIDVANIATTETDFDTLPALFDAADGIPTPSATGCTEYFTSSCRTVFTNTRPGDNTAPPTDADVALGDYGSRPNRVFLTTGMVDTDTDADANGLPDLHQALGSTFTAAEAKVLVSRILAGRDDDEDGIFEPALGGVDRSTVAVIEESPFAGVARPTMVYFGALDGMIHAVCANVQGPCVYRGQELWAFMPRTQLGHVAGNTQRIDGSVAVAEVFGDFEGTGVRSYRTILTFQTGSGNPGFAGKQPAVIALDVTDPTDPQILWEVTTPATREAFELGVGLDTAMGPVKVGNDLQHMTFAQTNNGGTGGSGFVIVAIDSVTGEERWSFDNAYPGPANLTDPRLRDAATPGVPATGFPSGVVAYDAKNSGVVTSVIAPSLYGELYLIDAGTGLNTHEDQPLFKFTTDFHPIGATPALFRQRSTNKLLAVAVSGGYADPVQTSWPSATQSATITQYAVGVPVAALGVPMDETTVTASGGFVIDLGVGNRAFAQATVAGNELFIITDSGDVNDAAFGLGGATGTMSRYSLSDLSNPILVDTAIGGGAGSVDVSGGVVYTGSGKSTKKIDISADFDADGSDVSVGSQTRSRRLLWLRLR